MSCNTIACRIHVTDICNILALVFEAAPEKSLSTATISPCTILKKSRTQYHKSGPRRALHKLPQKRPVKSLAFAIEK